MARCVAEVPQSLAACFVQAFGPDRETDEAHAAEFALAVMQTRERIVQMIAGFNAQFAAARARNFEPLLN